MNTSQSGYVSIPQRLEELTAVHGSLNGVAEALSIDKGYLNRLYHLDKVNPGRQILRRLGLKKVTLYQRLSRGKR